jgi:hypothetical protein
LTSRVSFSVLGEAIERGFARARREQAEARELFITSWWCEPATASRWVQFAMRNPWVPIELEAVVARLRAKLSPPARLT